MRVIGVIAEYNPFHNGHLYQLSCIRRHLNPDLCVVTMSGDFVQRGEPAIASKWVRTRMALEAGVDLVVELPYLFAVARADIFAAGAVSVLHHLNVSHLVFGSECGRIDPFFESLAIIEKNSGRYDELLMQAMEQGMSYPNAHAAAYRGISQSAAGIVDLTQPNNRLGFQYIKAIEDRNLPIKPVTFARKETDHRATGFLRSSSVASARSIRTHLLGGGQMTDLKDKVPPYVYALLEQEKKADRLTDWERFYPYLKYRLLTASADELAQLYETEEGIEHRLLRTASRADSFHAFITQVKTKRYTWARLQRLAVHILTNTTKAEAKQPAAAGEASYLRLLGMSTKGQAYLAQIRKKLTLPVISKIRKNRDPILHLDIRAAQLYDFVAQQARSKHEGHETAHPPIRYDGSSHRFIN